LTLNISVLGALIGKQKGRNLEIMNSFELMFHVIDSAVIVDREYYTTKEDQCKWSSLCIRELHGDNFPSSSSPYLSPSHPIPVHEFPHISSLV